MALCLSLLAVSGWLCVQRLGLHSRSLGAIQRQLTEQYYTKISFSNKHPTNVSLVACSEPSYSFNRPTVKASPKSTARPRHLPPTPPPPSRLHRHQPHPANKRPAHDHYQVIGNVRSRNIDMTVIKIRLRCNYTWTDSANKDMRGATVMASRGDACNVSGGMRTRGGGYKQCLRCGGRMEKVDFW